MRLRKRSRWHSVISSALVVGLVTMTLSPLQAAGLSLQIPLTPARAQNMQVMVNGGVVRIQYDLAGTAGQTYETRLEVSRDDGLTYAATARSVSGDVGRGIRAGSGKAIVWEAGKDTDSLQLDKLRFRVVVVPETGEAAVAGSGAQAAGGASSGTQPSTQSTGKRNSMLWPAIGLMGGGAALAIMGAAGPLRGCYVDESFLDPGGGCVVFGTDRSYANDPVIGTGLAVAAAGGILLWVGQRRASHLPELTISPGRLTISHTMTF